jgi:alpha-1,3-rhamnosyl/mannosyltransferase
MRIAGTGALTDYLRLTSILGRYELYHEPNHIPLACALPTVATLQDLSVLVHPEWHPIDRVALYEREFEKGLRQCRHVLAISEFTRQEAIRVLGLPAERITTTPLGVRSDLAPQSAAQIATTLQRLGLPSGYLLYVGTIEPRKNLEMLMRAYCDLPLHARERCPLVLAGAWGWNSAECRAYYDEHARQANILHLGYVADADLAALYGGASALLLPSHYEGFGLPPLEMMACGGAVITSTADALVEVVGSRAHQLPPDDLPAWRDAMQRIILDDAWRQELCDGAIELSRTFSWNRCARQTFDVYRSVLREASSTTKLAG